MSHFRIALPLAAVIFASVASAQTKRPMSFSDLMELKNVGTVALAQDASAIAFSVSTWEHPNARPSVDTTKPDTANGDRHEVRSHLWIVPVSGGAPRQLTDRKSVV